MSIFSIFKRKEKKKYIRVFVTQYALTQGVIETFILDNDKKDLYIWHPQNRIGTYLSVRDLGVLWFWDRDAAMQKAMQMREDAIKPLQAEIDRLNSINLTRTVPYEVYKD